ncbi:MAG: hypothetical protein AAF636_19845 [Pseudomonadota bacterium]
MSQMLDWLPAGHDISAKHLAVRVNPPTFQEFLEDLMVRATAGNVSVVFRVTSPETQLPIVDLPYNHPIPKQVQDDYGVRHDIAPTRDVEMIVQKDGGLAR